MKKEKDLFVAVLIDGDNASSEKMGDVMRFVSRYGTAVVRRIYGDWTKKKLSGWKDAGLFVQDGADFLFCAGKEYDGYCVGYGCDGHPA